MPPATAGQVIISEFRMSGPGGTTDEYVELYNNTDVARDISNFRLLWIDSSGSSGNSITLPANTVIQPRGHYLVAANGGGYSLTPYAATDQFFPGLAQNSGVGLFKDGNLASAASRIDGVLFSDANQTGAFAAAIKEGTPLAQTGDSTVEHAWVRDMSAGKPKDTDNNAADFRLVSTTGATIGGVQSTLGAPGPENSTSPIDRSAQFSATLLDTQQSSTASPNRSRDLTSDPANCSQSGTMTIRRTFTNNTGAAVTRLRFRIIILTTFPAPSGFADLRARTVADSNVTVTGGASVLVRGTTLETPPAQPNCGGVNSSLSLASVTTAPATFTSTPATGGDQFAGPGGLPAFNDTIGLNAPLANGASVKVQFLFGVQQSGKYRFYVNIEALP